MSKKKKRTRANYSQTFKTRAVNLAKSSDKSASHVARELGVAEKTLLGWIRSTRGMQEAKTDRGAQEEQKELEHYKREVARLQDEVDILRKATAYFANIPSKAKS